MRKLKPRRPKLGKIQMHELNIIVQPRRTFNNLDELAESIRKTGGFLMAPIVALFSPTEVLQYLDTVNAVYSTTYEVGDLIPSHGPNGTQYFILLAGERRTRAYKLLVERGLADAAYWADVRSSLAPVVALEIQLAENTHVSVPHAEEAHAYNRLFRFERTRRPQLSMAQFARRVGRSAMWVSNALRFCELPETIQNLVENGMFAYGSALQLTRLQKSGVDESALVEWTVAACVHDYSVAKLKSRVDSYLFARSEGQCDLLALMEDGRNMLERRQYRRRVVAERQLEWLRVNEDYVRQILALYETGLLGTPDAVYAEGSPRRRLRSLMNVLLRMIKEHPSLFRRETRADEETVLRDYLIT